jgi:hypothetical protein
MFRQQLFQLCHRQRRNTGEYTAEVGLRTNGMGVRC